MELNLKENPIIHRCSSSKRNKGKLLFIPDDILVQILCRLPDKPLFRFKSVSKAWYLLISKICAIRPRPVVGLFIRTSVQFIIRCLEDPLYNYFFSDFYLLNSKRQGTYNNYASLPEEGDNNGRGKLFDWEESLSSYSLPFKPEQDEFLDCCNGLLLFVDFKSSQYYVSNPATRQCVLIPQPRWNQMRCLYAALAFDPSQSSVYRIVQFQRFTIMTTQVLEIYSSDSRSWSRHKLPVPPCIRNGFRGWFRPATYFNGSLFRLSFSWHLIRFNICEEVSVSVIELPLSFKKCEGLLGRVGVLMGQLCYAKEYHNIVHIWSLEKEGSHNDVGRWILRHRINLCGLTRRMKLFRKGGPKWVEPITFHPTSNVVFLGTPLVVLSYNLDDNILGELIRIEENVILPGCFYPAFTYVRFLTPFSKHGNISPFPTY